MAVGFSRDQWYNYIVDRSHPPVASAVVEKPEYDPDHVYAWKPANNYKGWKLIDRGEAGVDDASVIQSTIDALPNNKGKIVFKGFFEIDKPITLPKNSCLALVGIGKGASGIHNPNGLVLYGDYTDAYVTLYLADLKLTTGAGGSVLVARLKDSVLERCEFNSVISLRGGVGYGCRNVVVRDNLFTASSPCLDFGINMMGWNILIEHNRFTPTDKAVCMVVNNPYDNVIIRDNYINGSFARFVDIYLGQETDVETNFMGTLVVEKNRIVRYTSAGWPDQFGLFSVYCDYEPVYQKIDKITFRDNKIWSETLKSSYTFIDFETLGTSINELIIENNSVESSYTGDCWWIILAHSATAKRCIVKGNAFKHGHDIVVFKLFDSTFDEMYVERNYFVVPSDKQVIYIQTNVNAGRIIAHKNAATVINFSNILSGTELIRLHPDIIALKNSGIATFSGDGSKTQFLIAHGLASTPDKGKTRVWALSADAADNFWIDVDDTYIYVNYKTAPPSGTDNVVLGWYAEV